MATLLPAISDQNASQGPEYDFSCDAKRQVFRKRAVAQNLDLQPYIFLFEFESSYYHLDGTTGRFHQKNRFGTESARFLKLYGCVTRAGF